MLLELTIPGSKSIANRALILNYLCGNKTKIENLPTCDDTEYLRNALNKSVNHKTSTETLEIFTGNAGTTTRFLTALAPLLPHPTTIDGNERMRERPISELVNALIQLGAEISCPTGCPPLAVNPKNPKGGRISLKGNISSQYLSAILMTSAFYDGDTEIEIKEELYSKPYIDITIKVMADFGLKVSHENYRNFEIAGQQHPQPPKSFTVESDASNASYFGAYAALNTNAKIKLNTLTENSIQGDIKFLEYLKRMGCKIETKETATFIEGPESLTSLGKIDFNSTPDLVMTFAVLALFCDIPTTFTNIANLRIKETDRISALENELKKFGAEVKTGEDYLKVHPINEVPNKQIKIETYDDHRMAMCFAILTKRYTNIVFTDKECVSKSYPDFWNDLNKL